MRYCVIHTVLLGLFITGHIFPQNDSLLFDYENLLIPEISGEEYENIAEIISYYRENPLDLNEAGIEDLAGIPFTGYYSAQAIKTHREKYGRYFSVREIYGVEGLSREEAEAILPFVTVAKETGVTEKPGWKDDVAISGRSRYSKQNGDTQENYTGGGGPEKLFNRVKVSYRNNVRGGFLAEKDPWERDSYDFTSWYLRVKSLYKGLSVWAGDYSVSFGEGLLFSGPYRFMRNSMDLTAISGKGAEIREYTSAVENRAQSGVALSYSRGGFTLYGFYSQNRIDAVYEEESGVYTSFPATGYHRTESELDSRMRLRREVYGAALTVTPIKIIELGLLYGKTGVGQPGDKFDIAYLPGRETEYYSVSYRFNPGKIRLTGETVLSGGKYATLNNLQFLVNKKISVLFSVRDYPAGYYSFFTGAFAQKGGLYNERGYYSAIKVKSEWGLFTAGYDIYKFPEAYYLNPLPASGNEIVVSWNKKAGRKLETGIRAVFRLKEEGKKDITENYYLSTARLNKYRFLLVYKPSEKLRLKFGMYYTLFDNELKNETGLMFMPEFYWYAGRYVSMGAGLAVYNTGSYDSAVYMVESGLPGYIYARPLYSEGSMWYVTCKAKYGPAKFSLRYNRLRDNPAGGTEYSSRNESLAMQLDIEI